MDFGVAEIGHLPGFCQHRVGRAAAFLTAGEGHHAVGAELVAAFDDGHISAVRIGAGGELGFKALVGLAIVESGDALLPCLELHQHLRQLAVGRRSAHHRNVGRAIKNLFALLLRHAAQDAETLALFLKFLVVGQAMKDFLLGFVADGTGVVEDQPGFFDGLNLLVSFG